jgi:hypothetical protein
LLTDVTCVAPEKDPMKKDLSRSDGNFPRSDGKILGNEIRSFVENI